MSDPYPDYPLISDADRAKWSKRTDGSQKGDGWLGVRKRPDGSVSTEISAGITIDGKEVEVPLMVPGLTKQEMDYLMRNNPDTEQNPQFFKAMPPTILEKAAEFAKKRLKEGKSPFRSADEPMQIDGGAQPSGAGQTDALLRKMYPSEYRA